MSLVGWFDAELEKRSFFDRGLTPSAWFDDSLIATAAIPSGTVVSLLPAAYTSNTQTQYLQTLTKFTTKSTSAWATKNTQPHTVIKPTTRGIGSWTAQPISYTISLVIRLAIAGVSFLARPSQNMRLVNTLTTTMAFLPKSIRGLTSLKMTPRTTGGWLPISTQPTTTVRGEPHTLSTWGAKALRTNVTVGLFRAAQLFQASALSYTTTVVGVGREAKLRVGRFRAALKTRKY